MEKAIKEKVVEENEDNIHLLTEEEKTFFIQNGYLVVKVFDDEKVQELKDSLHQFLFDNHGIDHNNLLETGDKLRKLSSTGGAGGILDIYYPQWKMELFQSPKLFSILSQLWLCSYGSEDTEIVKSFSSPYQGKNEKYYEQGYMYIDRIGYRVPDVISEIHNSRKKQQQQQQQQQQPQQQTLGSILPNQSESSKPKNEKEKEKETLKADDRQKETTLEVKDHEVSTSSSKVLSLNEAQPSNKKKIKPLQRSLTPHLDVCPRSMFHWIFSSSEDITVEEKSSNEVGKQSNDAENNNNSKYIHSRQISKLPKWRPLQSFISLTPNHEHDRGGFECAPGFHHHFEEWAKERDSSNKVKIGMKENESRSQPIKENLAPCVGEFTPIRMREDADVIAQFQPIFYDAGCIVIWDYRLPHANGLHNRGSEPREVIYGGYLPNVDVNQVFAQEQLKRYKANVLPIDQWREGFIGKVQSLSALLHQRATTTSQSKINGGKKESIPIEFQQEDNIPEVKLEEEGKQSEEGTKMDYLTPFGRKLLSLEPWALEP